MSHPPFTHITITFIILMPPTMLAFMYFLHNGKLKQDAWILAPVLSFWVTVLIYITMYTGSLDFDHGQEYLTKEPVTAHSDLAEILLITSIGSVVLAVLGRKRKALRVLYLISLVLMISITIKIVITGTSIIYK